MSAPTRRMLTKEQAADYCGFKSVEGFLAHVKVRPVMFGRSVVRYDIKDLDAFLDTFRDPAPQSGFAELISAGARRGRS